MTSSWLDVSCIIQTTRPASSLAQPGAEVVLAAWLVKAPHAVPLNTLEVRPPLALRAAHRTRPPPSVAQLGPDANEPVTRASVLHTLPLKMLYESPPLLERAAQTTCPLPSGGAARSRRNGSCQIFPTGPGCSVEVVDQHRSRETACGAHGSSGGWRCAGNIRIDSIRPERNKRSPRRRRRMCVHQYHQHCIEEEPNEFSFL